MNARRIEAGLWTATLVFGLGTFMTWRAARVDARSHSGAAFGTARTVTGWREAELISAADRVVSTNPFRIDRKPSSVPFRPDAIMGPGAYVPPKPAKPALSISGIIGGPPWAAVLEGAPGTEGGKLVRSGDVIGALTIQRVGRDTVVIIGADTTWKLTVRRIW